jgi:hypothetical protein
MEREWRADLDAGEVEERAQSPDAGTASSARLPPPRTTPPPREKASDPDENSTLRGVLAFACGCAFWALVFWLAARCGSSVFGP